MTLDPLKRWAGRLPLERWLAPRGGPVVVVLMYHDLRAPDDFPNWLRVPVDAFAAQLEACRALGGFVAPEDLLEPARLARGRLSFLVTFDDGYRNNADLAAPILEERRIPALVFVSTGPVATGAPFWTDVVVTPIQALGLTQLDLREAGFGTFTFAAGDPARRWDDIQRLLVAIKSVGDEDQPRVAALLAWLRETFAEALAGHLPRFRPLVPAEIARLQAGGCCRFGSHGHDHRLLTRLDDQALSAALARSRDLLQEWTGERPLHVAYPNGDRDERVMAAAAAAGYRRGYAVRPGLVAGRVRALDLPRVAVGGFDTPAMLRFKIFRELLRLGRCVPTQLDLVI
jgi:peptidoglycan/xylan/chitin deacetylase (PgdA/CDA1 family)